MIFVYLVRVTMEIFWRNCPNWWMAWDCSWYCAGKSKLLCFCSIY